MADPPTLDPATDQYLKNLEIELRLRTVQSNVRGDVELVPRQGPAEALFESYEAAMQYNSRPICTLEEYIEFLGPDGLREQLIGSWEPSALYSNKQVHPAPFYVRIRRLRQGPPLERPSSNITNSLALSDAPASATPIESVASVGFVGEIGTFLSQEAPEVNRLIEARLLQLAGEPGNLEGLAAAFSDPTQPQAVSPAVQAGAQLRTALTGGVTMDSLSQLYPQLESSGLFSDAELNQLQIGIDRAGRRLAGESERTVDATGTAPSSVPTTGTASAEGASAAATPAAPTEAEGQFGSTVSTVGEGVSQRQVTRYPVAGIPTNFPDTRANWDELLEQYRYNVLVRKAPLP